MNPQHVRARLHDFSDALILAFAIIFGALLISLMALSLTGTALDFDEFQAPDANGQAAQFHGNLPNVGGGQDGARYNANPNDDDQGIHGIAAIKDRQGRQGGTPPACDAHGGFATADNGNPNC